jgi:hypothetical protein
MNILHYIALKSIQIIVRIFVISKSTIAYALKDIPKKVKDRCPILHKLIFNLYALEYYLLRKSHHFSSNKDNRVQHSIKKVLFEMNVHLPKLLHLSEMKIIIEEKKKNFEPLKITNNTSSPTQHFSRKNNHPVEPLL